jgi:hypothetical protein
MDDDDDTAIEFTTNFNSSTTGFAVGPDGSIQPYIRVRGNAGHNLVQITRPSAGVWHHYTLFLIKAVAANEDAVCRWKVRPVILNPIHLKIQIISARIHFISFQGMALSIFQ